MRIIPFILVTVLALALAADAVASAPRYSDASRADWSAILAAGSEVAFPADTCGGQRPSDYHVYDMRGRPFVAAAGFLRRVLDSRRTGSGESLPSRVRLGR